MNSNKCSRNNNAASGGDETTNKSVLLFVQLGNFISGCVVPSYVAFCMIYNPDLFPKTLFKVYPLDTASEFDDGGRTRTTKMLLDATSLQCMILLICVRYTVVQYVHILPIYWLGIACLCNELYFITYLIIKTFGTIQEDVMLFGPLALIGSTLLLQLFNYSNLVTMFPKTVWKETGDQQVKKLH